VNGFAGALTQSPTRLRGQTVIYGKRPTVGAAQPQSRQLERLSFTPVCAIASVATVRKQSQRLKNLGGCIQQNKRDENLWLLRASFSEGPFTVLLRSQSWSDASAKSLYRNEGTIDTDELYINTIPIP
jgi:hypothetical protein